MLCCPILDSYGSTVAVFEAINPLHGGPFGERDVNLCRYMQMQISIASRDPRSHTPDSPLQVHADADLDRAAERAPPPEPSRRQGAERVPRPVSAPAASTSASFTSLVAVQVLGEDNRVDVVLLISVNHT